jgi:hypothetical protein
LLYEQVHKGKTDKHSFDSRHEVDGNKFIGYPPKTGKLVKSGFPRNDFFTGKFVNHGVFMHDEFFPP